METNYIEYKTTEKFVSNLPEKKKEWGKVIVGFANRGGGHMIIGINDDGTYEGYGIFDKFADKGKGGLDKLKEKIEDYCYNLITPPIVCNIEYLETDNGQVVEIHIPCKQQFPHAIVDGIKRTYYIKTNHGVQPIQDNSLIAWLYNNHSENNLKINTNIFLETGNVAPIMDIWNKGIPSVSGLNGYVGIIQNLYNFKLSANEIQDLYFLLFPYAILYSISHEFHSSWRIERNKSRGFTQVSGNNAPSEKVKISELLKSNLTEIIKIYMIKKEVVEILNSFDDNIFMDLSIPKGTNIRIKHVSESESEIMFNNSQFEIIIKCFKSGWFAGLGGSPFYNAVLDANYSLEDIYEIQNSFFEKYQTIHQQISINATYDFPENGQFEFNKIYQYVNMLCSLIEEKWDTDYCIRNMSLIDKVYSMDYKLQLILDAMKNIDIFK